MGHPGREGGLRTPKGPHPSAPSPQRLGRWGRGALGQLVLEAAPIPAPKVRCWASGRACRSSGLALREFRLPAWLAGKPQVAFSLASACPEGLYGEDCQLSCLCRNGGTCDPVSGHCTCPEGWAGLACEKGECRAGGGGGLGVSGDPRPLPWSLPSDGCLVLRSRALGVACGVITPRCLSFPRTQHPRLWVQEA